MKIALFVIVLIVAAIALVLVIGALLPRHHVVSRSATFRATPAALFALMTGPQTWRSNIRKYEALPTPAGTLRWKETGSDGQAIEYEVVEQQPPSLLRTRIVTRDLPYGGGWTFALQPHGESTEVRITEDADVYNPIFRFVGRFFIGYRRSLDTYLADLARASGQTVEIRD